MSRPAQIIAVTGAAGALGKYAILHFRYRRGLNVLEVNRDTFTSPEALAEIAGKADVILHFAGVNRAPDAELAAANPALAQALVAALERSGSKAHVIYASTVHEESDSVYGQSKREAGDAISNWAAKSSGRFTRLLLPHIFSELVRSDYNSGIATFCNRVATGVEAEIIVDAEIHPVHASEVCGLLDALIDKPNSVNTSPLGDPWRMSDILSELQQMHALYMGEQTVPSLSELRLLHLFNCYRAHLYPQSFPIFPVVHTDERGHLFEAMRALNGGQSFISTTRPGITRGNHFHFHKVERFCVLRGDANISLRHMGDGRTMTFNVSGSEPCYVDMPTLWTHNITNTGDSELLTLFWTHEIYDPANSDTYPAKV